MSSFLWLQGARLEPPDRGARAGRRHARVGVRQPRRGRRHGRQRQPAQVCHGELKSGTHCKLFIRYTLVPEEIWLIDASFLQMTPYLPSMD